MRGQVTHQRLGIRPSHKKTEEGINHMKKATVLVQNKHGMTWEEWEKTYPPKKAKSMPHLLAHNIPFSTYREAIGQLEFNQEYHGYGGMAVVEWNDEFYVVYEEFTDWEKSP